MQNFHNEQPVTVTEDLDFRGVDESDLAGRNGPTPERSNSRAQQEDQFEQQ